VRPKQPIVLLCSILALVACGVRPAPQADGGEPLDGLRLCPGSSFVAALTSSSSEDPAIDLTAPSDITHVYGLRPDGTVQRLTSEDANYQYDLAADASHVLAVPYGAPSDPGTSLADGSYMPRSPYRVLLAPTDSAEVRTVLTHEGITSIAEGPDGRYAAIISRNQSSLSIEILTFDLADSTLERQQELSGVTVPTNLAWSPDGATFALLGKLNDRPERHVITVDANSGETQAFALPQDNVIDLDWSPDSKRLLVLSLGTTTDGATSEYLAHEIQRDTGRVTTLSLGTELISGLAYASSDGRDLLAVVLPRGTIPILRSLRLTDDRIAIVSEMGLPEGLTGPGRLVIAECARGLNP
jgi:WD40 repeat protein